MESLVELLPSFSGWLAILDAAKNTGLAAHVALGGACLIGLLWMLRCQTRKNSKDGDASRSIFISTKHAVEGFPMIPNSHWLLGHLPLMRQDDFRKAQYKFSYQHADAQGRCCFWMGTTPALSVSRAADAKLVLMSSTHRTIFALMTRHMHMCLGKRNIASLMGKEWKSNRSVIVKALHATAVQQSHAQNMIEATEGLIRSLISQQINSTDCNKPCEIEDLMKALTMDVFGRSAMTTDFGCCRDLNHESPVATAFEYLTGEMMRRISGMFDPTNYYYSIPLRKNRRHKRQRDFLKRYINDLIVERRKILDSPDCPTDLLTNLIKAQDDIKETTGDEKLSEETLSDVLVTLLFAGYETTSVTLTYALYLISQHPQLEARCLEEIERVWKSTSTKYEDLVYIKAVVTETLRLYPPAISTTRSLEKDLVLDGITVKEGTYLYVPIWWIQRDAKHFPDPERFLPERWVTQEKNSGMWCERSSDDSNSSGGVPMANRDAFVAFSAGARSCAGQKFALQESTLALAAMLKALKFQAIDGYALTPHRTGFVQKPKDGMPMLITERDA